jgi:hypothetical protein
MYYAKAASVLTSDVITVTISTSTLIEMHAFGVTGANFTTPFDSNGALPAVAATSTFVSFTTSNANDIMIATYRHTTTSPTVALSGWSSLRANDSKLVSYFKVVTATQSGTTAVGALGGSQQAGVGTAIVRGP